jgi:hypothetical protein
MLGVDDLAEAELTGDTGSNRLSLSAILTFLGQLPRSVSYAISTPSLTFQGTLTKAFSIAKLLTATFNLFLGSGEKNPILDPSFEYDEVGSHAPPGWNFLSNSIIIEGAVGTVTSGGGAFGNKYLSVTTTGTHETEGASTGFVQPCTLGVPVTTWVWLRGTAGEKVTVKVHGDGGMGGSGLFKTLTSSWAQYSAVYTPTANGLIAMAVHTIGKTAMTFEMDAASFTSNYFDGDSPHTIWEGTPGNSISIKQILSRNTLHQFVPKLTFLGTIQKNITQKLEASLTFVGNLQRVIVKIVSASLSFAGSLIHNMIHALAATLSFLGTLTKVFSLTKTLTANLSFLGSLSHNVTHTIQSTLSFLGSLRKSFEITKHLQAALTSSGILQRTITHAFIATLTFLGLLRSIAIKNFLATVTFAGTLQRRITHGLTALLTFSTSLLDHTIYGLKATLTFAGALPKRFEITKRLTATLPFVGTLQRYISFTRSATLQLAGVLGNATIHRLSATLTFVGSLPRNIARRFSSSISSEGVLSKNTSRALTGVVSFTGSITSRITHSFSASLSLSGTLSRSIKRMLVASIGLSGSLGRSIVYKLEAALRPVGRLQRAILHQLAGALGVSGKMSREIYYPLIASVTFVGTVGRSVLHQFYAALETVGKLTLNASIVRRFVATLDFSGQIAHRTVMRILEGTLNFVGSIFENHAKVIRPLTDSLVLKQENIPTLTVRRTEIGNVYGLVNHLEGYPEMEMLSIVKRRKVFKEED